MTNDQSLQAKSTSQLKSLDRRREEKNKNEKRVVDQHPNTNLHLHRLVLSCLVFYLHTSRETVDG